MTPPESPEYTISNASNVSPVQCVPVYEGSLIGEDPYANHAGQAEVKLFVVNLLASWFRKAASNSNVAYLSCICNANANFAVQIESAVWPSESSFELICND